MNIVKGIFNKKFIFFYSFLLLLILFFYFNSKYEKQEITYAIIYIFFGMMISLFYILKDFVYSPDRMNYKQVIMEDALYNHKGEIIEEFEAYPLYQEFVTFHLMRKSEDPYSDTVTSIQAVKYIRNKMVDSLFIPIDPSDPLLKKYTVPLNEAIGIFLRYAGELPIIIYNQPFTHTYLNIKLDKEVHISFIDAMKMSKDLYGITNKPLGNVQKYLRLYNLGGDQVAGAKVIGAIYLDYIYTVSKYRNKQAKKLARKASKTPMASLAGKTPEPNMAKPAHSELESAPPAPLKEKRGNTSPVFETKVPEEEKRIIAHTDSAVEKPSYKNRLNNLGSKIGEAKTLLQEKLAAQKDNSKNNEEKSEE